METRTTDDIFQFSRGCVIMINTLKWHGPLMLGNIPIKESEFSAVYMYSRCYAGTTTFYVGKAQKFRERLASHIGNFLSTKNGSILREDGSMFRSGGLSEYFRSLQSNLDETLEYALKDLHRVKFIYTRCDKENLGALEATIVGRLLRNTQKPFACENGPCSQRLAHSETISNDTSNLAGKDFPAGELERLLTIFSWFERPILMA
jgi:hypothetical protein